MPKLSLPHSFYTVVLPRVTLALVLLVVVLGALVYWLAGRPARRAHIRRRQGQLGEEQAVGLLQRAGYTVIVAQHAGSFDALVGGERWTFALRADFLVRRDRDGQLWLAEVKTGSVAPRLQHGPTRRQLLEYTLAFQGQIAGVLLVAPELGDVTPVSFPALRPVLEPPWPWWLWLGLGAGGAGLLWTATRLALP